MGLFDLFKKEKKPGTKGYRKQVCEMLGGKQLKCTVERGDVGEDTVIGRGGDIQFREGILTVYADGKPLFACPYADLEAGELMSHDGCMLRGPDQLHEGTERMLLCYYLYWRKIES